MRRLYILLASVVIATTLVALTMSSVSAQAAEGPYGAIAVAPSIVNFHYDVDLTKARAQRGALANCRWLGSHLSDYRGDCQGAVWVHNGWMALAFEGTIEGPPYDPAWGSGWGRKEAIAIRHALRVCQRYAGESCKIDSQSVQVTSNFDPSLPTRGGAW
jgi:hypothetical protein